MKRDLTKAYRQIFICVGSIHLMGYVEDGLFFFDLTLSMGLKIAAYICQRVTDAIMYIYYKRGFQGVNYLDDLGAAERAKLAQQAFVELGRILSSIGMWEAEGKASPPDSVMIFLGLLLNAESKTIEITPDRLVELRKELLHWKGKRSASIKEVQALVGKLSFAATTVQAGRLFFSRVLNFLRTLPGKGKRRLPGEVYKDIDWWSKYMEKFDGKSIMMSSVWANLDEIWTTDACTEAAGGWCPLVGQYFHAKFPKKILAHSEVFINELECLAIIVAMKKWGPLMSGRKFVVGCDNEVTVTTINTGRARNKFMQACL